VGRASGEGRATCSLAEASEVTQDRLSETSNVTSSMLTAAYESIIYRGLLHTVLCMSYSLCADVKEVLICVFVCERHV
jgi:hypothetical protein